MSCYLSFYYNISIFPLKFNQNYKRLGCKLSFQAKARISIFISELFIFVATLYKTSYWTTASNCKVDLIYSNIFRTSPGIVGIAYLFCNTLVCTRLSIYSLYWYNKDFVFSLKYCYLWGTEHILSSFSSRRE